MHFEIGLLDCFVQNNAIFYIGIFSGLRVYVAQLSCRTDELVTEKPNSSSFGRQNKYLRLRAIGAISKRFLAY